MQTNISSFQTSVREAANARLALNALTVIEDDIAIPDGMDVRAGASVVAFGGSTGEMVFARHDATLTGAARLKQLRSSVPVGTLAPTSATNKPEARSIAAGCYMPILQHYVVARSYDYMKV